MSGHPRSSSLGEKRGPPVVMKSSKKLRGGERPEFSLISHWSPHCSLKARRHHAILTRACANFGIWRNSTDCDDAVPNQALENEDFFSLKVPTHSRHDYDGKKLRRPRPRGRIILLSCRGLLTNSLWSAWKSDHACLNAKLTWFQEDVNRFGQTLEPSAISWKSIQLFC